MHPISNLLFETYEELLKEGQLQFPLLDKQKEAIDSIVKTVNGNWFGTVRFPTPIEKASAYLCLIIKDHAVTDGNKRLAVLWFRIYCIVNKLKVQDSAPPLDQLAVAIELEKRMTLDELVDVTTTILFEQR